MGIVYVLCDVTSQAANAHLEVWSLKTPNDADVSLEDRLAVAVPLPEASLLKAKLMHNDVVVRLTGFILQCCEPRLCHSRPLRFEIPLLLHIVSLLCSCGQSVVPPD